VRRATIAASAARPTRLYEPRPVDVVTNSGNAPVQVENIDVVQVREEWIVEDGWWTAAPVSRWYFEVVLIDGRDLTLFCAFPSGHWFAQRA